MHSIFSLGNWRALHHHAPYWLVNIQITGPFCPPVSMVKDSMDTLHVSPTNFVTVHCFQALWSNCMSSRLYYPGSRASMYCMYMSTANEVESINWCRWHLWCMQSHMKWLWLWLLDVLVEQLEQLSVCTSSFQTSRSLWCLSTGEKNW